MLLFLPLPLFQSKNKNFHVKYSSPDEKKDAVLIIKDRKLLPREVFTNKPCCTKSYLTGHFFT